MFIPDPPSQIWFFPHLGSRSQKTGSRIRIRNTEFRLCIDRATVLLFIQCESKYRNRKLVSEYLRELFQLPRWTWTQTQIFDITGLTAHTERSSVHIDWWSEKIGNPWRCSYLYKNTQYTVTGKMTIFPSAIRIWKRFWHSCSCRFETS